ncbi:MAG: serine--tRNA ligase, partial [Pseudobdellovibrionaceae bacterium]
MIDIKLLEKKADLVDGAQYSYLEDYKQTLLSRNFDASILDKILDLSKKRKDLITQAETAKSRQNKISSEVAILKRQGQDASALMSESAALSASVKELEIKSAEADQHVTDMLLTIPNKIHASVPVGKSEEDNVVIKKSGSPTVFS